ncbi:phosphotransferase [Streptomyces sp. NPDC004050]
MYDWAADGFDYRAELYAYATAPAVSASPVLETTPDLPETWWKELAPTLDILAPVTTHREAVREEFLRRVVPQFTGRNVGEVHWCTAHGDFHWANLTIGPHPLVLDWEGWGTAPAGYDAATLYTYALRVPPTPPPESANPWHTSLTTQPGVNGAKWPQIFGLGWPHVGG